MPTCTKSNAFVFDGFWTLIFESIPEGMVTSEWDVTMDHQQPIPVSLCSIAAGYCSQTNIAVGSSPQQRSLSKI